MRTTSRQREDMMHLLRGGYLAILPALLAHGILGDVAVAYALPCCAISPFCSGIAPIFVIMRVHGFLVLIAVSAIRESRATGIATGPLWLFWHSAHSFRPSGTLSRQDEFFHRPSWRHSKSLGKTRCCDCRIHTPPSYACYNMVLAGQIGNERS